jgi:hypothetical protein
MSREEGTFETKTKWVHARDGRGRTENPLQRERRKTAPGWLKKGSKCEETEMKRVTGMKNDGIERKRRSEKEEKGQEQVWSPNTQTRPWSRDLVLQLPIYFILGNKN